MKRVKAERERTLWCAGSGNFCEELRCRLMFAAWSLAGTHAHLWICSRCVCRHPPHDHSYQTASLASVHTQHTESSKRSIARASFYPNPQRQALISTPSSLMLVALFCHPPLKRFHHLGFSYDPIKRQFFFYQRLKKIVSLTNFDALN